MKRACLVAMLCLGVFVVGEAAYADAIHDAAKAGDVAKVRALLKADPKAVNATGDLGMTPLHWAADRGQKEVVELLLSQGANLQAQDQSGWTPLHQAAYRGQREIADLLLAKGATMDVFVAAALGDAAKVRQFLAGDSKSARSAMKDGSTLIFWAATREVAELALAGGADIKAVDDNGLTPLHSAASQGHREVVEFLLARGAEVNARAKGGFTSLHFAAVKGYVEIGELLIRKGADVNAYASLKGAPTPLVVAEEWGQRAFADLLRKHGGRK